MWCSIDGGNDDDDDNDDDILCNNNINDRHNDDDYDHDKYEIAVMMQDRKLSYLYRDEGDGYHTGMSYVMEFVWHYLFGGMLSHFPRPQYFMYAKHLHRSCSYFSYL